MRLCISQTIKLNTSLAIYDQEAKKLLKQAKVVIRPALVKLTMGIYYWSYLI